MIQLLPEPKVAEERGEVTGTFGKLCLCWEKKFGGNRGAACTGRAAFLELSGNRVLQGMCGTLYEYLFDSDSGRDFGRKRGAFQGTGV